jgi:acetyl-CoA carboxylase carboxyltransferase component
VTVGGPDDALDELAHRRRLAAAMGGEERVARQRATGRLTVRDRLDALLDRGSFREIGGLAGAAEYDADGALVGFIPANLVTGEGRLDGRRVVVAADDFTVRGGAADAAIVAKQEHAERAAHHQRIPILRLLDGTGGGGSVKSLLDFGRTYVPWNPGWDHVVANLAAVPVAAAALGPVAGLGAARLVSSHFSVMVRGLAQVFIAGPAVVEAGMGEVVDKEALGGWEVAARAGTVDNLADSEADAFAQIRRFLSYLPPNAWTLPPVDADPGDDPGRRDEALRDLVPGQRRRPYDVRRLMGLVCDEGSVFELGRHGGGAVVTALARLDGHPVAVLASDPMVYGGGLTAAGADAMARFVDLADTFHLPVVHLVDQPGFVIGSSAEAAGTLRRGARAIAAVYQAQVPWASVLVRRVFGVAGAGHRNHARHGLRVAWPSGDWGSLPIEGGLEVAFKRLLAESPDAAELREQIAAQLEAVRSPFRTAEAFLVEDVIDPADTRPLLCEWVRGAYATLATEPPRPPAWGLRP